MLGFFVVVSVCYCVVQTKRISVTITGSTGVLGSALTKLFLSSPQGLQADSCKVYAGYRNQQKALELRKSFVNGQPSPQFFESDLLNPQLDDIPGFGTCFSCDHRVLVNNAAVCIAEKSLNALSLSLETNFLAPLRLTQQILSRSRQHTGHTMSALTVLNISSGDGELCCLNTGIRKRLESIEDLTDLVEYAYRLVKSYDSTVEYAFGNTPFYSISKAFLNKATILLDSGLDSSDELIKWRVLACCPGNFVSTMSTQEEMDTAVSANEAAERILPVVFDYEKYMGGMFYRNGEIIDW